MSGPIRIALVGLGKIARDQHMPSIAGNPAFALAATVSRHGDGIDGVPHFAGLDALRDSGVAIDAVALCTPPQVRRAVAADALAAGWHVFLEKPPGATLAEVSSLVDAAAAAGLTLFASWHSRHAAGVAAARDWLAKRTVESARIVWREDVRVWHPGQDWIWEPGGFGVFDPGINALSIVTAILPRPIFVSEAKLDVPSNRAAPIAAQVSFSDDRGTPVTMDLDFRQQGPQSWDIIVETDAGRLTLSEGGAVLDLPDGRVRPSRGDDLHGEYKALYQRFATLVTSGSSDVDATPLQLVADIFLKGRQVATDPFVE